ncbi:MAG: succinylglutamate desuccinylase/aspartoacylase family protein [Acidobacteria bacterium]|nr:succinylglutamate desuccinylase/aspartoacylase family protein [Acidobacteriota bacterium]
MLGEVGRAADGPTLIVIGGLHGNEPAGVEGLQQIFDRLRDDACNLPGRLVGLTGNRAALEVRQRFIDKDLNRVWLREHLQLVRSGMALDTAEDHEAAELDTVFRRVLAEAQGITFVLDVHTTSGPGPAFSVLHDTLPNRRFARAMSLPIALGLEEELNGTLTDYFTELGALTLSVEAGQHDDPHSVDRTAAAIWIAMDVAGLMPECYEADLEAARSLLELEGRGLPEAVEVRYRHPIPFGVHFDMDPGFESFQRVTAGEPVGSEEGRSVGSPMTGLMLMPLYQEQGEEGFFITSPVRSLWLDVSTALRRLGIERWLSALPGVRQMPQEPGTYLVNRRAARFVARQIFHLLGYRRRDYSATHLVMEKRPEPEINGHRA